jgi:DNA-binding beta-propeller fold protein YncE
MPWSGDSVVVAEKVTEANMVVGRSLVSLSGLVLGALLTACASAPPAEEKREYVFPPPPDEARFIFDTTLVSTAQVQKVENKSRFRMLVTGETLKGQGMPKPFDVTACRGRIYVSDTMARRVFVFDPVEGRSFDIGGSRPGALRKPMGVDTDANCNLYVADMSSSRVVVYDRDGNYITAMGGSDMFDRLSHVAVDQAGERVYVVDTGGVRSQNHRVRVFDAKSGDHLFDIGTRGSAEGEFNLPRGIAVAPDGTVYVVDAGNFRVQAFDRDGKFLRTFGSLGRSMGHFARPKGVATDLDGNVYVVDTSFGNFQIFDDQGQLLMFVGDRGSEGGPAEYMLPNGIGVDEDGRVYIVDQFFRKVDIYRPASLARTDGHLGVWFSLERE